MGYADFFAMEIQHDAGTTRKYFERLPEDKFDFAPHAKSMKLGVLAGHLADIPGWTKMTVETEVMVFDPACYVPFQPKTRDEIIAKHDQSVAAALEALKGITDEHLMKNWKMTIGDATIIDMPRAAVLRNVVINHTVHHRAQLGVYLRLLDVPVPSTYGPSADEQG